MKKRILIAEFKHETNSFSPSVADRHAFENRHFLFGEELIDYFSGIETELGAFLDVLNGCDNFELYPCIAFNAEPSGPVTKEIYELATSCLVTAVQNEGPFDGILLALHGAMVAQGHPDGEGDLLETLRQAVGPKVPIVASLDLHANVTQKMVKNATALIPFEYYPHTDTYQTALLAAETIKNILLGKISIRFAYAYIPFLLPLFPTEFPEIAQFNELAHQYTAESDVCFVRITHGFFLADFQEMGMSVVAAVNGSQERANQIVSELSAKIWNCRHIFSRYYPTLDSALDTLEMSSGTPIVFADASDNPGAGGMGDTTHLLRRILQRGIHGGALATIHDPNSVAVCMRAGVGATVCLNLGGLSNLNFSGGPLHVHAKVLRFTNGEYRNRDAMDRGALVRLGDCAVVDIGGNVVIISSFRTQPYDLEAFRSCGITPEKQRFLIVKSAVHYRASYGRIAYKMIDLALPGYAKPIPSGLPYQNWKNPPLLS